MATGDQKHSEPYHCPHCGASFPVRPYSGRCWLCGEDASSTALESLSDRGVSIASEPAATQNQNSFSLATLMLIVTLICVWLGVTVPLPGLGILMAIVSVPSLVMVTRKARQGRTSQPRSDGDKLLLFFQAEAVVMIVFLAASAAFAAVCVPAGLFAVATSERSRAAQLLGLIVWITGAFLGIVLAIFVGRRLFKCLWSK